jgi:hypothetical protein
MNKIKILLVGFAAISASSLCMATGAAPPPPVATEKVISFDSAVADLKSFDVAVCDIEYLKVPIAIEREAVSYVVRESSTAGRSAVTYAKVSAHGRMCRLSVTASPRSHPLTYYGQRT